MEELLGVMIDVEMALNQLAQNNLYTAGIAFFCALGYPVEPLTASINESMARFVYLSTKNHCVFSPDETDTMQHVASISWLFSLRNEVGQLRHANENQFNDVQVTSVNYFSVQLNCSLHDRSHIAFALTKIISKVVGTPVVILFKHVNHLLFSSILLEGEDYANGSKVYLSDWYLVNPIQEDVLIALSSWQFGDYCNHTLLTLLVDWIQSMARTYFIDVESYEFSKYGGNSVVVHNPLASDEIVIVDDIRYLCPSETFERVVEVDYRELYGYDYVASNQNEIEILPDDPEWAIDELLDLDDIRKMIDEADLKNDDQNYFDDEESQLDSGDRSHLLSGPSGAMVDFNCLDNRIFKNPLDVLKYLELLDQNK